MIRKILIGRVLMPACLIFTAITLVFTGIVTFLGDMALTASMQLPGPTFSSLVGFFAYSLLISAINQIFYVKSLGFGLKLLLHYIGFIGSFLVIFLLILSDGSRTVGALILAAALTVFYLIGAAVAVAIRHVKKNAEDEKKTYKNMFS